MFLRQLSGTRTIELVAPANVGFWGIAFARDGQSIYYSVKSQSRPTGDLFQIPTLGGTPDVLRHRQQRHLFARSIPDRVLPRRSCPGRQHARGRECRRIAATRADHQASARVFRARLFRRALVVAGRQADRRRACETARRATRTSSRSFLERHRDRVSGPVRGRERNRLGARRLRHPVCRSAAAWLDDRQWRTDPTFSRSRRGRCVTSPTMSSIPECQHQRGRPIAGQRRLRYVRPAVRSAICRRGGAADRRDPYERRRVGCGLNARRPAIRLRAPCAGTANALVGGGRRQRSAPTDERRNLCVAGRVGRRSQPGVLSARACRRGRRGRRSGAHRPPPSLRLIESDDERTASTLAVGDRTLPDPPAREFDGVDVERLPYTLRSCSRTRCARATRTASRAVATWDPRPSRRTRSRSRPARSCCRTSPACRPSSTSPRCATRSPSSAATRRESTR